MTINQHDNTYHAALRDIYTTGKRRLDRTGVGTIGKFGLQQVYDLRQSYPGITSKKLFFPGVKSELLWFLEGSGDERRLAEILHGTRDPSKRTIWTDNANSDYWKPKAQYEGDLGRVYGVQWRDWQTPRLITKQQSNGYGYYTYETTDQLLKLVDSLTNDPYGRRHIISAWNPGEFSQMALPPCHCFAQFYVQDGELSCLMHQRSSDFFLGVPFNIASYALLTHMLAQVCGLTVGDFIHSHGDAHIYSNHTDQVELQLSRYSYAPPTLWLNPEVKDITRFTMDDIKLINYQSHPTIPAPMAV